MNTRSNYLKILILTAFLLPAGIFAQGKTTLSFSSSTGGYGTVSLETDTTGFNPANVYPSSSIWTQFGAHTIPVAYGSSQGGHIYVYPKTPITGPGSYGCNVTILFGYYGGEWVGNTFRYNTAVTRVNPAVIHNTYVNKEVVNKNTGSRASFNGPSGAQAKPTAQEEAAAKAEHVEPTASQRSRVEAAKNDPALSAKNNKGKPKSTAVTAFDRKNGQQPGAAAAQGSEDAAKKQAGAEKAKGRTGQEDNGNSAFGHGQGDATTRTKGSQNNAYGKAQSGDAHDSHRTAKAARTEGAAAPPHAPKADRAKHNGEARKTAGPPHAAQHQQTAPHRAQAVKPGQAAHGHGPAPAPQNAKKKKKGEKEKPDGGQ